VEPACNLKRDVYSVYTHTHYVVGNDIGHVLITTTIQILWEYLNTLYLNASLSDLFL
jgi:hypothetical protein